MVYLFQPPSYTEHVVRQKGILWSVEKHVVEYVILKLFAYMVLKTNLGSTVKVKSRVLHSLQPPVFERIFFCFQGVVARFLGGCRPFTSFDGCHLKGPFASMLLVASSLDANLQFYPITMGIVESENKESWKWFLTQLEGTNFKLIGKPKTECNFK